MTFPPLRALPGLRRANLDFQIQRLHHSEIVGYLIVTRTTAFALKKESFLLFSGLYYTKTLKNSPQRCLYFSFAPLSNVELNSSSCRFYETSNKYFRNTFCNVTAHNIIKYNDMEYRIHLSLIHI